MSRDSLPQRALEMHRRTGQSLDDCLFAAASQDAIEHPTLDRPPWWGRCCELLRAGHDTRNARLIAEDEWQHRAPMGRMVGANGGRHE